MGADKAVHVSDEALHGSDALVTSEVIAKVLGRIGFDLVILGSESTDARMGVMAAMLAERLGRPAAVVRQQGRGRRQPRSASTGRPTTATTPSRRTLPAVVSVVEKINEPRYPSFKGIMAAKKKPVETLTLADLELDAAQAGLAASGTEVVELRQAAAAAGRHDRDRRGRRRRQGG